MTQPFDSIHCVQLDQSKRTDAIQAVWGQATIPATLPGPITPAASPLSSDSANLSHVERWEYGATSPRVFHPSSDNGKATIVHQGHNDHINDLGLRDLINALVDDGFMVVALVMPGGDETTSGGTASHNALPLSDFLTPVAVAVNRLEALGFIEIYMTGLSGGGWTTTVYSGLDSRITRSVDVAGSFPLYIQLTRDHEQLLPGIAPSLGYLDLYLYAASDGRHVLIRHIDDACCFDFDQYNQGPFVAEVGTIATSTGGDFRLLWVDQVAHEISSDDRAIILDEFGVAPSTPEPDQINDSPTLTGYNGKTNQSSTGEWVRWTNQGNYGDLYSHTGDTTGHTATWNFTLTAGKTYELFTTWTPHLNRATNAPYRVLDAWAVELASISVNQEPAPAGGWHSLGQYVATGDALSVELGCNANEHVIADAVLARDVTP